ncbi:hypothetical protein C7212DRAFT_309024 [Tuber magnatum]|uniref:Uncharacterized protein n=1 Tax=Tuber magnatum TaxID=42249 RepID=A0A317SW28_9PEZI|nr:hypothetical protein C7212DRAFT_309024 [Tuber magnatum]
MDAESGLTPQNTCSGLNVLLLPKKKKRNEKQKMNPLEPANATIRRSTRPDIIMATKRNESSTYEYSTVSCSPQ